MMIMTPPFRVLNSKSLSEVTLMPLTVLQASRDDPSNLAAVPDESRHFVFETWLVDNCKACKLSALCETRGGLRVRLSFGLD